MSIGEGLIVEGVTRSGQNGILTLTIDVPEKRNALTADVLRHLRECLIEFQYDDALGVAVLTGSGKVFCSGGDTRRMGEGRSSPLERRLYLERGVQRLSRAFQEVDKPLVAAINGPAVGAGMDLALACDLRIASSAAYFKAGYSDVGVVPGFGAAWHLPRLVGESRALEILWSGRKVTALEALDLGLLLEIVPPEALAARANEMAESLAGRPLQAVRMTKRLVRQAGGGDLNVSLDMAASHFAVLQETDDHVEGIRALKESRPPRFTGR